MSLKKEIEVGKLYKDQFGDKIRILYLEDSKGYLGQDEKTKDRLYYDEFGHSFQHPHGLCDLVEELKG